jgi:RNA polymerase sigma factor (sigma-70 family)
MTLEDKLFIDYCKNGNEKSFEELFRLVKPWLSRMLYRIVSDTDATYDLQQETWIKLIGNCSKFNPERGRINNFIFTIAKNEALRWKFNISKKDLNYESNKEGNEIIFGKDEISPESIYLRNEKNNAIRVAITKLKKDYQDVILMYYYAEFDVKEISKLLDKPEGTIKSWLERARKKLETILSKFINKEI